MAGVDLSCKTPFLNYTDEDVKKILAQYDRKLETIGEDIDVIKKWFKAQPHIPVEPSDRLIAAFLIMNKFSIEKTKEKLDMNFTIKSLIPEYYKFLPKDPEIVSFAKGYHFVPLPKLTQNKNRVYVSKIHNTEIFDMNIFMAYFFMSFDLRANIDICNSEEYIMDFEDMTAGTLAKIGPVQVRKCFLILEKVYANRIGGLHLVNMPPYADAFISLMKSAMKPKIRDRIYSYKKVKDLQNHFPKEILPEEYGGDEKSLFVLNDNWLKYLSDNQDLLEEIRKIQINEELRPTKLVNDEILGFHGNFRKLEVD